MLNTNVLTMRNIIQNYRFVIPNYQRGYSWDTERITDLWNDVIEVTEVRNNPDSEFELRNHFLGSILTTSINGKNEMILHIIDGQQRMTSLTILTAVLLDICVQNRIQSPIFNAIFSGRPATLIELNEGDDYFQSTIITPSRADNPREARLRALKDTERLTNVESNIFDNYKALYTLAEKYISNDTAQQKSQKLSEILGTFLDYIYLVRIHVPNNANTIRIFRTLNDRGMPLSPGDLAKSAIFQSVLQNPDDSSTIARLWEQTFEQIEPDQDLDEITEYLRHYFISTQRYIKMNDLPDVISDYVKQLPVVVGVPQAVDLMRRMNEEAVNYNTMVQANSEYTEINDQLKIIRKVLGVSATYPAVLAAFSRWRNHPRTLTAFLKLIENFTFRHFHVGSNKQVPAFETLMSKIGKHIRTHNEPLGQVQSWLKDISPDNAFVSTFRIATFGNNTMFKYIYWRLEQPSNIKVASLFGSEYKINPIMPKSPNDYFSRSDLDPEYYKRIGNMIMWPTKLVLNKNLQPVLNQPVATFRNSISSAQDALRQHRIWNTDAIDTRQAMLAEIARDVWTLDIDI